MKDAAGAWLMVVAGLAIKPGLLCSMAERCLMPKLDASSTMTTAAWQLP